ncbi:glutathione S-transferase LANCL1-like [Neocloeon triangulifer]|uniref:glutathione S-transferase LANCL1-like n=1 Tax=Neocloeon triangulifer TaxID=2078957 RepID=UPI00286EECFE|nr:glutathione S-transferase LANCL1-like [Neocloeon triangulifer]
MRTTSKHQTDQHKNKQKKTDRKLCYKMDERREFENPYEDYETLQDKERNDVINIYLENKVNAEFSTQLKKCAESLLVILDRHLQSTHDQDSDYSVYTGSAGIALMYFHISQIQNAKKFLKLAEVLLEPSLPKLKGKRLSLMTGDAGPLAVAAAVHWHLGNKEKSTAICQRLTDLLPRVLDLKSDLPDEVLYGRAGYLLALLFVRNNTTESNVDVRSIQKVVSATLASGKMLAASDPNGPPLMYEWHGKKYLGAAHGIAGILFVLIQSMEYLSEEKKDELEHLICQTLDFVLNLCFPSGNFPSSIGNNSDRLVHWCHGAPAFVPVLCLAYKVFAQERYLHAAETCAKVIWKRGLLKKGYGLCHGVSGNGYALLHLYQTTKNIKYLYQGLQFARWCTTYDKNQTRKPDRPYSLFEGLAGTIHFLVDAQNPEGAKFPAFYV